MDETIFKFAVLRVLNHKLHLFVCMFDLCLWSLVPFLLSVEGTCDI